MTTVRAEVESATPVGDGFALKIRLLAGEIQPGMRFSTGSGANVSVISLGFIPAGAWAQGMRLVTVLVHDGAVIREGEMLTQSPFPA